MANVTGYLSVFRLWFHVKRNGIMTHNFREKMEKEKQIEVECESEWRIVGWNWIYGKICLGSNTMRRVLLTGNGICEHTDDGPIELNMDLAM